MKAAEIRESFLKYFESKEHKRVPSSSLVPQDDPTLLFTNAGMNQFKDVFLGQRKVPYKRATSSQKCIRAGGKHNDLENVGETARHQTFFEMLGNFSFGDYFKEDAIKFAWDYIQNVLKLPTDRLYATVYNDDDEAFKLWEKIAPELKNGRIMRFGEKDNFWSMGETGPCGPCSEIHFDRGVKYSSGDPNETVNAPGDRYMEIWNLVFMQFNRDAEGKMTPLPKPSVDTGAGLERISMVLQKVDTNYDTDLFIPLIKAVEEITGKEYFEDRRGLSHRVIADHIRALSFAIADGALPSNEGRGYVLRRILRRASRHGRLLDKHEPFIYKLSSVLVDIMGQSYPELKSNAEHVALVVKSEEESFGETLDRGITKFQEIVEKTKARGQQVIHGRDVFLLYDTFGFPTDMTEVMAREVEMSVDWPTFEQAMEEQRSHSKGAAEHGMPMLVSKEHTKTEFVGYDDNFVVQAKTLEAQHLTYDGKPYIQLVLDRTPFYTESGGQIGDRGTVKSAKNQYPIEGTVKYGDTVVHLIPGSEFVIEVPSGQVVIEVDGATQKQTQRNHTATHLLHKALRATLGEHVQQKGSLVAPDRLRFDFSHFKALSEEELNDITRQVNEQILANRKVTWKNMPIDEAKAKGAMALFGEKYGDIVRMVEVEGYSRELCGGTHVQATGEIGLFTIISESAIAAGIRRIEAMTGEGAFKYLSELRQQLESTSRLLKLPNEKVVSRVDELLEESKKLKKELEKTQAQSATGDIEKLYQTKAADVKGVKVVVAAFESKDQLNAYADYTNSLAQPVGGVFFNPTGQYAVIASPAAIAKGFAPRVVINEINAAFGGKGGGREYFTQGSSGKPLDEALVKSTVMPIVEKAIK